MNGLCIAQHGRIRERIQVRLRCGLRLLALAWRLGETHSCVSTGAEPVQRTSTSVEITGKRRAWKSVLPVLQRVGSSDVRISRSGLPPLVTRMGRPLRSWILVGRASQGVPCTSPFYPLRNGRTLGFQRQGFARRVQSAFVGLTRPRPLRNGSVGANQTGRSSPRRRLARSRAVLSWCRSRARAT